MARFHYQWRDHHVLIRTEIASLVERHVAEAFPSKLFIPGETTIPVSGRTFDAEDVKSLVDSALDFWLTTGRFAAQFEREFASYHGLKHAVLCNSGSSANLLAISALTSPQLGDRRLTPGDEVITVAAGFPTTVNPILQNGLVPVFVDVKLGTYNVDAAQIEAAIGPRTKAIILAHALGNPFDVETVLGVARRHNLWLVEDCCDALGSTWDGRLVGTFGDLATHSFYPAHAISSGEGGCVVTGYSGLKKIVESFRDWGRDCWCEPGKDNTCGKRFDQQLGDLPHGFDHKYTYSHIGYNLKATDMQAAILVAQMQKLPAFIERRKRNFARLLDGLRDLEHIFVLPTWSPRANPSWFGFPLTCQEGVDRRDVIRHLESFKVATRLFFGGNLLRQPAYRDTHRRVLGDLQNSDRVMRDTFWVGVYPGISDAMVDYMVDVFHDFAKGGR